MEKLAWIFAAGLMTTDVFAQGYYNFNQSFSSALVSTNAWVSSQFVLGGGGGAPSGLLAPIGSSGLSATYYFAVLIQPFTGTITSDTNVWDGTWTFTGIYATNRSSGSSGLLAPQSNVRAPYWPVGVTNQYIVAGWSANMGSTWEEVSNTIVAAEAVGGFAGTSLPVWEQIYFGVSSVGDMMLSSSGFGSNLFGAPNANGNPINSPFTLYDLPLTITNPTPEPATIALVGLTGLSLLWFRRHR
jgi:hypothetical protein